MTQKDNLLRVINHDNPEWVPNGMGGVSSFGPPTAERCGAAGDSSADARRQDSSALLADANWSG